MTNEERFYKNRSLVYFVIKKQFKNYEVEDIIPAANLGLWKAILTYDENSKSKFSSFAVKCIRNEILNEMRKENLFQRREIAFSDFGDIAEEFVFDDADEWDEIEPTNIVNIYLSKLNRTEVKLFLDFANLSQREMAKKYHTTQPQISKLYIKLKAKILKIKAEIEEKY